jgi:hypothetical protein
VRDVYNENYKSLKKEIEEYTRRWKDGLAELIMRNGYTAKSNLHVQSKPIKILMTFLSEIEKSTLQFTRKQKRLQKPMQY